MSKLRVYYSPDMAAAFPIDSPSPRKPALVVQDWQAHGLAIDIVPAFLARQTI